jgi:hypothetical protein
MDQMVLDLVRTQRILDGVIGEFVESVVGLVFGTSSMYGESEMWMSLRGIGGASFLNGGGRRRRDWNRPFFSFQAFCLVMRFFWRRKSMVDCVKAV